MPLFFYPKGLKKDIEYLYIFCRYLDDIGDEKNIKKKESLRKLNEIKKEILKKHKKINYNKIYILTEKIQN